MDIDTEILPKIDDINLDGSAEINLMNKLTKDEWNSIEKPVDPITKLVLEKLLNYHSTNQPVSGGSLYSNLLKTCGSESYLTLIRPALVKADYLKPIKSEAKSTISTGKKEKKQVVKKDDQIRQMNLNKSVERELNDILLSFNSDKLTFEYGLRKETIEFRLVTLIYMFWFYLRYPVTTFEGQLKSDVYKLIQTVRVLTLRLQTQEFKSSLNSAIRLKVASELVDDLNRQCQLLSDQVKFDLSHVFSHYPWLTDLSNYYQVIPEFDVNLYPCQKKLLDLTNIRDPYLALYKSNFGSGKTTATIGVVANQIGTPNVVIYCCASDAVRQTVAQLAYNAGIKFAIASVYRDTIRITNNHNCKSERERKLIISDYATTYSLLKDAEKYLPSTDFSDLILIVDEPTDGADEPNNIKTRYFSRIFYYAPRRTILVSATLPSREELEPYFQCFKQKHEQMGKQRIRLFNVISKEVKVGCELIMTDGNSYSPHNDCQSKSDLEKVIDKLETSHFINRLYTANILISLYQTMKRHQIVGLFDLNENFQQASQLNHQTINEATLQLLKLLSQQPESVIISVCQQAKSTYSREDIYGVKAKTDRVFKYEQLGTTDAHKFFGPTLLIANEPIEFANTCFKSLLDGTDATQIISDYQKRQKLETARITKVKRELDSLSVKQPSDRQKVREEKETELDQLMDQTGSDLSFSAWKQINTYDHVKKFCPSLHDQINPKVFRYPMNLTQIPFDSKVSDQVLSQRFAGIGLYLPSSRQLDQIYTTDVITHTLNGSLAYTVSDTSISYGVNSPAQNLIITDESIKGKSIGTVLQLLARVGRPGLSWTAFAFIGPELKQMLSNYVFDREVYNPDATNLNLALATFQEELKINQEQLLVDLELKRQKQIAEAKRQFLLAKIKERQDLFDFESEIRHQLDQTNLRCRTHFKQLFEEEKPKPTKCGASEAVRNIYVPPGGNYSKPSTPAYNPFINGRNSQSNNSYSSYSNGNQNSHYGNQYTNNPDCPPPLRSNYRKGTNGRI